MLEEPPLLVVKRSFERADPERLAKLKGAPTGNLVDCMDGRGALTHEIKPVDDERAFFVGSALPVETGPSDNLAIVAALTVAKPNDVIIAASDGFAGTAVVGDIVAGLARNGGLSAIVIDGMARDIDGIKGMGLPVFSRGITPNSCVKSGPGRIGLPIVAGGVAVNAGDYVVGDRDGVVVIPRADIDRVLARLEQIRKAEGETLAKVAAGLKYFDAMAQLMHSDRVRYVD